MIMCVSTGKGATHDLTLFRASEVKVHPETALIGDAGYQGIWRHHRYALTPHKSSKHRPLTSDERRENRAISSIRQPIEHVIRRLKVFRILKEVYRHRRRRFGLRLSLISGLLNHMNEVRP